MKYFFTLLGIISTANFAQAQCDLVRTTEVVYNQIVANPSKFLNPSIEEVDKNQFKVGAIFPEESSTQEYHYSYHTQNEVVLGRLSINPEKCQIDPKTVYYATATRVAPNTSATDCSDLRARSELYNKVNAWPRKFYFLSSSASSIPKRPNQFYIGKTGEDQTHFLFTYYNSNSHIDEYIWGGPIGDEQIDLKTARLMGTVKIDKQQCKLEMSSIKPSRIVAREDIPKLIANDSL